MHEAMSTLAKCEVSVEKQHVEMSKGRIQRDGKDVSTLAGWFRERDPYMCNTAGLRSLSTGKTAIEGDGINCDEVEEVGLGIQRKMDNVLFTDVKLRKKDQVKTLERLEKGVMSDNKEVFMHTTQLFNRLIVMVERSGDMAPYFCYELTPLPASLFKNSMMRKPNKASLGQFLTNDAIVTGYSCRPQHVLDGGCLLHKVKWPKIGNYDDVLKLYVDHVKFNFGCDTVVVFDGYAPSTKDHEHVRRTAESGKMAADVSVDVNMRIHSNQQEFLANTVNKCAFIALLSRCLQDNGFQVIQARDDADTAIVRTALLRAEVQPATAVVADDTDVLVLLVHHLKPGMGEICMLMRPTTGRYKGEKLIRIRQVQENIGSVAVRHLLAIHALSGCDTTSAMSGRGKVPVYKRVLACSTAVENLEVMSNPQASQEEVGKAGILLLVLIYGGKPSDSLNSLRHSKYMSMCASATGRPIPERLPPTENAAFFHTLRAHLQVIQWLQLTTDGIEPTEWGWNYSGDHYTPTTMTLEPAPPELLKVIRCACKSSNPNQCGGNACTCKKHGLVCVSACGQCHGTDCLNTQPPVLEEMECEIDAEDEDESEESVMFPNIVNDEDIDWLDEEIVM
jgi:hypothetical protein